MDNLGSSNVWIYDPSVKCIFATSSPRKENFVWTPPHVWSTFSSWGLEDPNRTCTKTRIELGHCPAQTYEYNSPEEDHERSGRRGRWTMASCRQLPSLTFWPSAAPWIWFGRAGQISRQSTCPEPLALFREICDQCAFVLSFSWRNTSQNILVESEVISTILAVLVIVLGIDNSW